MSQCIPFHLFDSEEKLYWLRAAKAIAPLHEIPVFNEIFESTNLHAEEGIASGVMQR